MSNPSASHPPVDAARPTTSASSSSLQQGRSKQQQDQHRSQPRKIPIYVRIVNKDVWLRFHVNLNSTIGSIKDLALQNAGAPEHDPTLSPHFYQDAVNVTAAAKMMGSLSQPQPNEHLPQALPKSFIAPCPRPAPALPKPDSRSLDLSSASAGQPWSPSKSRSIHAWRDKAAPASRHDLRSSSPRPLHADRFDSLSSLASSTSPHKSAALTGQSSSLSAAGTSTPTADPDRIHSSPSKRSTQPKDLDLPRSSLNTVPELLVQPQPSRRNLITPPPRPLDTADASTSKTLLNSPGSFMSDMDLPFTTGNAAAEEEEARARARLVGWNRSISNVSSTVAETPPISPVRDSISKLRITGQTSPFAVASDSMTDGASTSDDDIPDRPHHLLPESQHFQAAESSQSLAGTSSNSSGDGLVTTEHDSLWGTQLEEELLKKHQGGETLDDPNLLATDRSRSKTVTAADVANRPELLPSTVGAREAAKLKSDDSATPIEQPQPPGEASPGPSSGMRNSGATSPVSADDSSSFWLDRGRLAGIKLDEMSRWRDATHGASGRYAVYSFSNGLLLEDWKTVAAYKLRPFELLEMQASLPTERVHLGHLVAAETYFESWVYMLKAQSVRKGLGTWKLRFIVVRGSRLDLFRKKPKSTTTPAYSWDLAATKWVVSSPANTLSVAFAESDVTLRCVTSWDYGCLHALLLRAHFRRGDADLVDAWRRTALERALIAGRGGTVQPGRAGRGTGRNAKARTRLRPPGWPRDWEDADTWSSDSASEDLVPAMRWNSPPPPAMTKVDDQHKSLSLGRSRSHTVGSNRPPAMIFATPFATPSPSVTLLKRLKGSSTARAPP